MQAQRSGYRFGSVAAFWKRHEMGRILVVEDEVDLNLLITRQLRLEGHDVVQTHDGASAVSLLEASAFDLVVLDWMLPKLDGLAVCRRLRERHITPVLMLTARGEEADIVLGLEVGADDYLTKPFRMRELTARVRAILRRTEMEKQAGASVAPSSAAITIAGVSVSPEMRQATLDGEEIDLTPKEFDLLALFFEHPGRAFSREYLLDKIWGDDVFVTDRTVDTHVQRLRKKLGDQADLIRTVWGIGYKLQKSH